MWFLTQWALHICCVNAWKYPSNSMSPWWCCHVWNALRRLQKQLRQTVFSLPTLARHTAANVLEVLVSLRLRQWLENWFEAFLWHTVLLSKESDCGKVIGLDHALLLLRCSGLSRHCARGAKGARARLWMSAAGPESVFHVAAMIAPWLKGFAWSEPNARLSTFARHAIISQCLFSIEVLWILLLGKAVFWQGGDFWLDGDQAAYTQNLFDEVLLSVTLPYIAQEHANVFLDPVSLAYLLCQCLKISQQFHVPVMMLPCCLWFSCLPRRPTWASMFSASADVYPWITPATHFGWNEQQEGCVSL